MEGQTEETEEFMRSIGQTVGSAAQTVENTFRQTKKSARDARGTVVDGIVGVPA